MNWLERPFYGNSILQWAIAAGIALLLSAAFLFAYNYFIRRLQAHAERTTTRIDDIAAEVLAGTHVLFLVIVAFYLGTNYLDLPHKLDRIIGNVMVVSVLIQAALWGNRLISWWLMHTVKAKRGVDGAGATTLSALGFLGRVALWSLMALMILENLGVNITALVASLGIGGIAVALAMQNILGDMFASLSITLDRPFVIGDFIVLDNIMGTVEHIGLKTTRLRSLSGELIVLSNTDLLKGRIRNYKHLHERRVEFSFGVVYETPVERLERISAITRAIVEAQPKVRFDRAHFKGYGDFALNFEVVYFVKESDYNVYMDIQQAINLALFRRFQEEGISFACSTRTWQEQPVMPPARPEGSGSHAKPYAS